MAGGDASRARRETRRPGSSGRKREREMFIGAEPVPRRTQMEEWVVSVLTEARGPSQLRDSGRVEHPGVIPGLARHGLSSLTSWPGATTTHPVSPGPEPELAIADAIENRLQRGAILCILRVIRN